MLVKIYTTRIIKIIKIIDQSSKQPFQTDKTFEYKIQYLSEYIPAYLQNQNQHMQKQQPQQNQNPAAISDNPETNIQYDLTGLSVPANNPYKKMDRNQLINAIVKLEKKNKQLNARLAFLEPQKQKEPICGTLDKRNKLFQQFQLRKYCLRIAYIGITYNGFILQSSTDNTIEHFLFKSLYACNLIKEKQPAEDYTRAGRTDRGVSAFGNVISLNLRTSIPKGSNDVLNKLEHCKIINANLPSNIRILSCQQVVDDFNARYWCTQRQYKYFFLRSFLDLQRMQEAIKDFEGTHNFINFCRIDVVATTNHQRTIRKARIQKFNEWECLQEDYRNQIYYFHFIGNAFLWHQIRFMSTILFMVGSHKEEPGIVKQLLDTTLFPRKPNYPISPEYPLILQNCKYQKHQFEVNKQDVLSFYNTFIDVLMKRTIQLHLYISCMFSVQNAIYADLKIDTKELTNLCIQEESKIFKTRAKKKLSLQKPSCINVKQAIDKLSGRRLDLFEKRMQKQAEYEQRVKAQAQKQENDGNE